MSVSK